jgi:hypothetical protein
MPRLMVNGPLLGLNRYVRQLGFRHLSLATTLASTSGDTSSSSQVLPKGMIVKVLLVHF